MKITGTNSYIVLDQDERKIKVEGEMVIGGFIAEIKSMRSFEPPHEDEVLTEEIIQCYINETIKKTKGSHMFIKFN